MFGNGKAVVFTGLMLGIFIGAIVFGVVLQPGATLAVATGDNPYQRPYPMPHQWWKENEEFYVFASGGQQGGLFVYGIPSMKYMSEIPVFETSGSWGWSDKDPKIRNMLTNPYTGDLLVYGDTHHPVLSRKNAVYDGRFVFIPDKMNPRVARVDLDTFRAGQIVYIPNVHGGIHGDHISPNSDLFVVTTEHEISPDPVIQEHVGLKSDPVDGPYLAGVNGIRVAEDGTMKMGWQVWGPFGHDLLRVGWGEAEGWIITTTYNSERQPKTIQMFQRDKDYLTYYNIASIEKAIAEGKFTTTKVAPDVPIVSFRDVEMYLVPIPLNPHGVNCSPTGTYCSTAGKATVWTTLVDNTKVIEAARTGQHIIGEEFGIPVIDPEFVYAAQLDLGLGQTHQEFDGNGYMYAGYFVDSDIKKVALGGPYVERHGQEAWKVVDVMPAHYSVGHLLVPGGDSAQPDTKYLISMNKLAKDTFALHGPLVTESHELYRIDTTPGKLIDQMPLGPETHYSQAIPVAALQGRIKPVYDPPVRIEPPSVTYDYDNKVIEVVMHTVRSVFNPDVFHVPQGWRVKIRLYGDEEALDLTHGFALNGHNVLLSIDPGEVREAEFVADKAGVHWFYCIWFCSELHLEMRGRMVVVPEAEWSPALETDVAKADPYYMGPQ